MDAAPIIALLAAHLLCSGALLLMIARRMPPRGGVLLWSLGLLLFGAATMARLGSGWLAGGLALVLVDAAMVGATLLFIAGLMDFTGSTAITLRAGGAVVAAFVVLDGAAMAQAGAVGRDIMVNLTLGALSMWLVWSAVAACRRVEAALRVPLAGLAVLMGALAGLALLRTASVLRRGSDSADDGLAAMAAIGGAALAAVLLAMGLLWMVFERLNGQLTELSSRDALTRALNRKGLDDALRRHFGSRGALPMVQLAVDVDHFKRINDAHGHATGDLVLRAVAMALARQVRGGDLVARVGGEEFAVCCPAVDKATVVALAERLREAIAALLIVASSGRSTVRCTVSIGVSRPFSRLADWAMASTEADAALDAAKVTGRNRVMAS